MPKKRKAALDAVGAPLFAVAVLPQLTGIAAHEWLGIAALVSATVLPAFGLFAPGYFVWDPLHAASAKVLLALVLVHAVSHAGKLAGFLKAQQSRGGAARDVKRNGSR